MCLTSTNVNTNTFKITPRCVSGERLSEALNKQLLTLLLDVTCRHGRVSSLLTHIARDVHVKLGDIDQVST